MTKSPSKVWFTIDNHMMHEGEVLVSICPHRDPVPIRAVILKDDRKERGDLAGHHKTWGIEGVQYLEADLKSHMIIALNKDERPVTDGNIQVQSSVCSQAFSFREIAPHLVEYETQIRTKG